MWHWFRVLKNCCSELSLSRPTMAAKGKGEGAVLTVLVMWQGGGQIQMVNLDTFQPRPRFTPLGWVFMHQTWFTTVFTVKYDISIIILCLRKANKAEDQSPAIHLYISSNHFPKNQWTQWTYYTPCMPQKGLLLEVMRKSFCKVLGLTYTIMWFRRLSEPNSGFWNPVFVKIVTFNIQIWHH
jgi:hypothetical protein